MSLEQKPSELMRKILILDDDKVFCTLISGVLSPHGYEVTATHTTQDALRRLAETTFAVLLCDHNLAEKQTGLDLIKQVRETNQEIEIVMFAGNPSLDVALEAFEERVFDFLLKPAHVRKVKQTIDRAMERYHFRAQEKLLKEDLLTKNRELAMANQRLTKALEEAKTYQAHLANSQKLVGVGEMTASISHEFNNILGAISGYSQLAIRIKDNPEYLLEAHRKIKLCADKAIKVVSNLLKFSRRFEPIKEPGDINTPIQDTISLAHHHIKLKEIQLSTDLQKDIPSFDFDGGQLQQVFLNLVTNACQAMKPGGSLEIVSSLLEDRVIIRFKDNGIGIPPENLEKIFLPFFSTKTSTEPTGLQAMGSGLGLYISERIIESHFGRISVHSEVHKGTEFIIELPLDQKSGEQKPEVLVTETKKKEEPREDKLKVLVVDDEADIREVLRRFLEDKKFEVREASDGRECLQILKDDKGFDLIFMDMMMPNLDGEKTLFHIQEQDEKPTVFMMSGYGAKNKIDAVMALGADRYIPKPFDLDELEGYIAEFISRRASRTT